MRHGARASNLFTIGKLIPLILFVVVGLFFIDRTAFAFDVQPSYDAFAKSVMLLVFAFSGFEAAVIPAGEGKDPQKHIPFALLVGIAIVVALYILIQFVCIGTLPELATSKVPLLDAAMRFIGPAGAMVITVGALISITGTLNSITLVSPRLLFAMADDGQLPRAMASTHAPFARRTSRS